MADTKYELWQKKRMATAISYAHPGNRPEGFEQYGTYTGGMADTGHWFVDKMVAELSDYQLRRLYFLTHNKVAYKETEAFPLGMWIPASQVRTEPKRIPPQTTYCILTSLMVAHIRDFIDGHPITDTILLLPPLNG